MRLNQSNNPFTILGVGSKPTDEEVRNAYRRLAMSYHPDRNSATDAEDKFKRIQQAYQLLKTESGRKQVRAIIELFAYASEKHATVARRRAARRSQNPGNSVRSNSSPEAREPHRGSGFGFLLRAHLSQMQLNVRMALRPERVPLHMLVYLFAAFVINVNLAMELTVFQLLGFSFAQTIFLTLASDFVLQLSANTGRHQLRRKIDHFIFYAIGISATGIFISYLQAGYTYLGFSSIGLSPELGVSLSLLILGIGGYLWLLFGLIFEKHRPFWEWILVTFGMGMMAYFSSFLYFEFAL